MVIARVTAHDGTGSGAATFGGTPTTGNLLIATSLDTNTGTTLSGWTSVVSVSDTANVGFSVIWAKTSAGNEGTVTPVSSGGFLGAVTVSEYSGAVNPFATDGTAGGVQQNGSATSEVSAAITTSNAGSLVFLSGDMAGNTSGISWSGGPTAFSSTLALGERHINGEYIPGTTLSGFTSTMSWTGGIQSTILIAAFKPASTSIPNKLYAARQAVRRSSSW